MVNFGWPPEGSLLIETALVRLGADASSEAVRRVVTEYGTLGSLLEALDRDGLPVWAPPALHALHELAGLLTAARSEHASRWANLSSCDARKRYWLSSISHLRNEVLEVAFLDAGARLLPRGIERLYHGGPTRVALEPRRILARALSLDAAAIIVAHNHPGGDPRPSEADRMLTRTLSLAACTLHVDLLDHLIVTASDAFSFREHDLL